MARNLTPLFVAEIVARPQLFCLIQSRGSDLLDNIPDKILDAYDVHIAHRPLGFGFHRALIIHAFPIETPQVHYSTFKDPGIETEISEHFQKFIKEVANHFGWYFTVSSTHVALFSIVGGNPTTDGHVPARASSTPSPVLSGQG